MAISTTDEEILRYSKQVVFKAMAMVRNYLRGSNRLAMKETVDGYSTKAQQNPTKQIDRHTEELMIKSLVKKFARVDAIKSFTIFSEEAGIVPSSTQVDPDKTDWVVFIDPIDGTEFAENLQGGWTLLAVYDRCANETAAVVAGDIFLDRVYWAVRGGDAEGLDFITHSLFKLDGGPDPRINLTNARLNLLTTKVSRFRAVAEQTRLLDAIHEHDGRINLSWGSNTVIQVAAGYADVALEFNKGFATYDILPGFFIAQRAGLTLLDLQGNPIDCRLDIQEIFRTYRETPKKPQRSKFVIAKEPQLARHVLELLKV